MNKLSRKDIDMLEVLAVTEESKGKLAEYIQQREKAAKAYKAFREAVASGVEVEKVEWKGNKFEAGDKALVLRVTDELNARKGFFVGDEVTVTGYRDGILWKVSEDGANVIVRAHDNIGFFREEELELVVEEEVNESHNKKVRKFKAGDKVRVLRTDDALATAGLKIGDVAEVLKYSFDGVVALKAPQVTFPMNRLELVEEKSPNELRAEVITRARACFSDWLQEIYPMYIGYTSRVDIRCVEVKLFDCNKLKSKGIAKCSPHDIFNEHIGKAIALGRALGKDVSEFENAVQPDKEVIGTVLRAPFNYKDGFSIGDSVIWNDTDAIYEEGVE